MSLPTGERILAAVEATWPARRVDHLPGWLVRDGGGGGKRVSSASATREDADIAAMEAAQAALGQPPLVMVLPHQTLLDQRLDAMGYRLVDPVSAYVAPIDAIATAPPPVTAFQVVWPPVQVQAEIWEQGGIGADRLAVMARATGPKCALMGRADDTPAGSAFVACDGDVAMVHALEIVPALRRRGAARHMMQGAAIWARAAGARWMTVLVTRQNAPANALYRGMGMAPAQSYHYRAGPGGADA
jgi:GNAT superfamily N-acetyltransferase